MAAQDPPATTFSGLRVLAISPAPTHPTTAGNRARYRALLDRLQSGGATVRLIQVDHEPGDAAAMAAHWRGGFRRLPFVLPEPRHARWNRMARRLRHRLRLPIAERHTADDWCDPSLAPQLRAEVADFQPDAILMLYLWFSAALEGVPPGVMRVLDAQDVFTDRSARMAQAGVPQEWFSVPRHEEARALARFDVVLAIQELEAAHYRALSTTPVVTVSHFLPALACTPPATSATLLILGSDNDVNVHGVQWFLREVWPTVLAARPDANTMIAGKVGAHIAAAPGVQITGVLPNVMTAYARCALVINPLQGGTGLKIKAAEALAAGRVVISTHSGAIGLEAAEGRGLVICADAGAMASAIVAALANPEQLTRHSHAAWTFAAAWNVQNTGAFDRVFSALPCRTPATARGSQLA